MADIYRVRVVFSGWAGGPGIATHFYHLDGAWNIEGYKNNLLQGVADAYGAFKSYWPTTFRYTVQPEIDRVDDQNGEIQDTHTGSSTHTDIGTANAGYGPFATGLCCTWRTGGVVAGKHVRGRTFLVPLATTAQQDDGTPTTAILGAADAWADDIENAWQGFGDLVVWSRPAEAKGNKPARDGSSYIVNQHTITDQFAVLRSRRP